MCEVRNIILFGRVFQGCMLEWLYLKRHGHKARAFPIQSFSHTKKYLHTLRDGGEGKLAPPNVAQ